MKLTHPLPRMPATWTRIERHARPLLRRLLPEIVRHASRPLVSHDAKELLCVHQVHHWHCKCRDRHGTSSARTLSNEQKCGNLLALLVVRLVVHPYLFVPFPSP